VYHAQLKGAAEFPEFSRYQLNEPGVVYEFDRAFIAFPFSDARSIDPKSVVQVNEKDTMIAPGHGMNKIFEGTRGVHVQAQTVSKNQRVDFSLELAGNEHLSFVPSGDTSLISVSSQLGSPSFSGAYLPKTSSVGGTGFTANWEISSLGRSFAHALFSENAPEQSISETLVETKLYEGVDHYALVERSIKYAILFITLTFMAFFFIEILNRLRVHPIQYLLIGVALGVFYLLLLSFSEQMIFPYAYALSSAMTILLISIYSRSVLKAGKHAWTVGGVLVLLYSYLYMVLNSEDYALLAGTLLLFAVLTFTMFITRKVNWYAIGTETAVKE
jgi:inner membrane protein